MKKITARRMGCIFILFLLTMQAESVNASFDQDPIKETQSKTVPVTEELLTREGEAGPASPSFKMKDTDRFLVKKPYEEVDQASVDKASEEEESSLDWWEEWFSWEGGGSDDFAEPVGKK
ncbi:MAG: hypothetical protein HY588_02495 [Candidatus Omnitrophica bacterium]|nr:hypothetical protein [Candidatus Omnitrophota bacterium]